MKGQRDISEESWIYDDALGVWVAAGKLQGEEKVGGLQLSVAGPGAARLGRRGSMSYQERPDFGTQLRQAGLKSITQTSDIGSPAVRCKSRRKKLG